ncbi:MAG: hypothetical protein H6696_17415 [Deferribacteres bacterium]|nr:hypothetical protein [candidate division KSB1 bacterium]MCB9503716.1 hypothetical protein [Deferribacteres bacterium]
MPEPKILKVECAHCEKIFHARSDQEAKDDSPVEIAVNCPYCEKPNIIQVPKFMTHKMTTYRGTKSQEQ